MSMHIILNRQAEIFLRFKLFPTKQNMSKLIPPLKVFLCYAHSDKANVSKLYNRIAKEVGIETWFDAEKLLPGQDWEQEIRKAILESDVIIICLSRQFNRLGGYRQKELKIALEKANLLLDSEIFIIPIRMEKCALPKRLRRWQCVDLFEVDGYRKLLQALRERL